MHGAAQQQVIVSELVRNCYSLQLPLLLCKLPGRDAKSQLLSRLSGSWCDIALQAAGSFFLEKAYAWASESEKEVIVSELASRSTLLMGGCPWGPMLARKLGLEAYQRR